jgi:hypothetical protein
MCVDCFRCHTQELGAPASALPVGSYTVNMRMKDVNIRSSVLLVGVVGDGTDG